MKIKLKKINSKHKEISNYKIKEEEYENNENFDDYEYLIKTLKKSKNTRTRRDQARINTYLCKNIDFFKNFAVHIEAETLQKITGLINYNHYPSEYKIYSFGDDVNRLYIILKGSIKIQKPVTVKKSMSLRNYVEYLVKIRDEEKDEIKFKRIQNYNKKVNRLKLIAIDYDYTKIPPAKEDNFIVEEEKEFNVLNEGNVFGEITLDKNEKRSETTITKEKCDIVSLDRTEFAKLRTIEEQKINNKLTGFKNDFPLFKYWNNLKLMSLIKGLITEKYEKGDYIYKQNDKPEYIYLIKEGTVEAFNYTKFHIYEEFIEYIHDNSNSLAKDMDDPLLWKEDKISQKIEKAYEQIEYMKNSLKKAKYDDEEELKERNIDLEMDESKQKLVDRMEKINDRIKNYAYKANIQKYSAPQIFGYLEAIELKRRLCSLQCVSKEAIISKIPIIDFLLLIPIENKNIFHMQTMLFDEKKQLLEQMKNNALAKLSFIKTNSLRNSIIKLYNSDKNIKGNNNQFRFTKTIKFRNDPSFSFINSRRISKSIFKRINSKNSFSEIGDRTSIKKSEILKFKKRLENNKLENSLFDQFKNTLIGLNKNKFEIIKKLYPKKVSNEFPKTNFGFTNRNKHNNNYIKFLETNKKFMQKNQKMSFNISMGDLTAKNYSFDSKLNYFNKRNISTNKSISSNEKFFLPSISTPK